MIDVLILGASPNSLSAARSLGRAEWGVGDPALTRGGLTKPQPEASPRHVVLLQRKASSIGKGLGKTSGWVHRAALKAGGRTLAVLGGALDKLYPPENRELAEEIAANGALISEFPLGRTPDRTTFPYRNRIVSGLCKGVLVVEAGLNSGAMNTAELAMEQGRSVMAVPGRVDMEGSRGPHRLIKNGARLVTSLADLLKEFEFLFPPDEQARLSRRQDVRQRLTLTDAEEAVVRALWAGQPLVWHIYPQDDGAHGPKLDAFLDWLQAPPSLRHFHWVWNGLAPGALPNVDAEALTNWGICIRAAREHLLVQNDLLSQLLGFCASKR